MKQILLPAIISVLIMSSCRKNNITPDQVNGSWKLVEIYDKPTATTSFRPAGSGTDVVITFLPGNRFSGHTLRNDITNGSYTLLGSDINFGTFDMTKVAEDQWGSSFVTVLFSCLLQSLYPCTPSTISIQGKRMKIATVLRYDIILERL